MPDSDDDLFSSPPKGKKKFEREVIIEEELPFSPIKLRPDLDAKDPELSSSPSQDPENRQGFFTKSESIRISEKIKKLEEELDKSSKKRIKIAMLTKMLSYEHSDGVVRCQDIKKYIKQGALDGINSRTKRIYKKIISKGFITDDEKYQISDLIVKLKKEIDRLTNKRIKIEALKELLDEDKKQTLEPSSKTKKSLIEALRKKFPRVDRGFFRKETKTLLNDLLDPTENNDIKNRPR